MMPAFPLPLTPQDLIIEEIELDKDGNEIGKTYKLMLYTRQSNNSKGPVGMPPEAMQAYKEEVQELVRARENRREREALAEKAKYKQREQDVIDLLKSDLEQNKSKKLDVESQRDSNNRGYNNVKKGYSSQVSLEDLKSKDLASKDVDVGSKSRFGRTG